ncbi:unnamed protein product [Caenorhabditis auriculariae]|uniref:THUMP domain-containing protein n=1 Tax=Caenorhabditis auriculariae TaxID=2777116 RepID=A0A8S1HF27_9PELO|nr:unnamed protein product [Caenorhabditis auriculariae]
MAESSLYSIYTSVITGFEWLASEEIKSKLSVKSQRSRGRVQFRLEPKRIPEVLKLRSIDNAYVIVLEKTLLNLGKLPEEEALREIQNLIKSVDWETAVDAWQLAHGRKIAHFVGLPEDRENLPKFRVTCFRAGEKSCHSFSSMDAAKSLGAEINNTFGWRPDMKNYDIELVLRINGDTLSLMVALNNESLFKRNVCAYGPTTMRSTICYCMVALAKTKPDDIVLDPLCGGGSIPLEGSLAFPDRVFFGGDNHPLALERCRENHDYNKKKLANTSSTVNFFQWDAAALPLKDDSVDAIVTDLPFGKKIGSKKNNQGLYTLLFEEWARVVRPGGSVVALTSDKRSIETAMRNSQVWKNHGDSLGKHWRSNYSMLSH